MTIAEREPTGFGDAATPQPEDLSAAVIQPAPLPGPRTGLLLHRPSFILRLVALLLILGYLGLHDSAELERYRTRRAAAPFAFSLLDWEVQHLSQRLGVMAQGLRGKIGPAEASDIETIRSYFGLPPGSRSSLVREAEAAIQRLITQAWRAENLAQASLLAGGAPALFPPVSFALTDPPEVLIVSPRDRIEVSQYVLLRPNSGPEKVSLLEDGIAARGLSSLVTGIGALASYPAMVLGNGPAESTLAAVAHEWAHAYFFFHPLGRGYWSSQDVRTINETAAELAGNELGRRLTDQLNLRAGTDGEQVARDSRDGPSPRQLSPRQTELNALLRRTRLEVDALLASGQVDEAEQHMEQRRLELNERGFEIRRLNQAYFAFYGSYAESPAGSSPIAGHVRRLRDRSASLGDFMRTIAQVSGTAQLEALAQSEG